MKQCEELLFSIIVPVYNRPEEVGELLDSLSAQTQSNFEIIIVEDGSSKPCAAQVAQRKEHLNVHYFCNKKSGPGLTRNYGCRQAKGNYYIFLDSDCILPPHYFKMLCDALHQHYTDAFGGPDRVREDFSIFQKAINHSMTSFFTTGGIRGDEKLDKFHPKSFNMGYSKAVFKATSGFSSMPLGEDTDMSIRIRKSNFTIQLIKEVFVFHKRRANMKKFIKQVYKFGVGRIRIYQLHPETLKWVYVMPALFTIGTLLLLCLSVVVSGYFLLPLACYAFLIWGDATIKTKSLLIGLLSVFTGFAQLMGYGAGFISALWQHITLQKA